MPIDADTLSMILAHVPVWVCVLFAWLIWSGMRALHDNTCSLTRVLIVPVVFILWGLSSLLLGHGGSVPGVAWVLSAAILAPFGLLIGPRGIAIDTRARLVHRRGSVLPLLRNTVLFTLQFGLGTALARHPEHHAAIALAKAAVSGAMAGYFLGWGLAFLRRAERLSVRAA